MIRVLKKVIGILTMFAMVFSIAITPAAAAVKPQGTVSINWLVDNDTIDSQYSNYRTGFSTYLSGLSNSYNHDARREVSSSGFNSRYGWRNTLSLSNEVQYNPVYVQLSVYLYDNSFTDPQAGYYLDEELISFRISTINQNLAPGGWNTFSTQAMMDDVEVPGWITLDSIIRCTLRRFFNLHGCRRN